MLIIRKAQFLEFERAKLQIFLERLLDHVRKEYPDQSATISEDDLRSRVTAGVERARAFGLESELSVATFAALTFAIGPRFDEQPSIRRLLTDSAVPPGQRIAVLLRAATPTDWLEGSRLC